MSHNLLATVGNLGFDPFYIRKVLRVGDAAIGEWRCAEQADREVVRE